MKAVPCRIVFLARKLDAGGAERQLVEVASGLVRQGFTVDLVLFYAGGLFEELLVNTGVRIHHLGKRSRFESIGFFRRLVTKLRSLDPDFVYSFLDVPNVIAALARPWIGHAKLVWSVRASDVDFARYGHMSVCIGWLEGRLSHRAHLVIANSHAGARWASRRGFPSSRIRVVENGIDTERFRPDHGLRAAVRRQWNVAEDGKLVGLVGRIDPMKDQETFLAACSIVARSEPGVRFAIVGTGSPERVEKLRALAEDLGISASVIWAGARGDMPAVYNALDVLCLTSVAEGFPNVVAEAMACGVPCVVTDVGDSGRLVGRLGSVIAPGQPTALAGAIVESLARTVGAHEQALMRRERIVENFSLEAMIGKTVAALRVIT